MTLTELRYIVALARYAAERCQASHALHRIHIDRLNERIQPLLTPPLVKEETGSGFTKT